MMSASQHIRRTVSGGSVVAVAGLAHRVCVEAVEQGVVIDEHEDLGVAAGGGAGAGGEGDEGVGLELLERA